MNIFSEAGGEVGGTKQLVLESPPEPRAQESYSTSHNKYYIPTPQPQTNILARARGGARERERERERTRVRMRMRGTE